ncbi:MAG: hypothetical protein LBT46_02840 [Planctomycetaceae bacterium]|jgi:hypothetical protein|nr:hypothetical protein [Planctomycetaceae bacterium]
MSGGMEGLVVLGAIALAAQAMRTASRAWAGTDKRYQTAKRSLQTANNDLEFIMRNASVTPDIQAASRAAKQSLRDADTLQSEADRQRRSASDAGQINAAERKLISAIAKVNEAKMAIDRVKILIAQKEEEKRQHELKRAAAENMLQNAQNEADSFDGEFLSEWSGDTAGLAEANQLLQKAEEKLHAEQFDESQALSAKSVKQFQTLYAEANENKQQFENREVIADAVIAALNDLQYDEPDVNYEPKEGTENTMLGSVTIFAKSKGESGDMRLAINLDGKVNLDIADIPEGKETECHHRIADLQSKVADTIDLQITDWGQAKNVKNAGGLPPRQRVQIHEQVKQRGA